MFTEENDFQEAAVFCLLAENLPQIHEMCTVKSVKNYELSS